MTGLPHASRRHPLRRSPPTCWELPLARLCPGCSGCPIGALACRRKPPAWDILPGMARIIGLHWIIRKILLLPANQPGRLIPLCPVIQVIPTSEPLGLSPAISGRNLDDAKYSSDWDDWARWAELTGLSDRRAGMGRRTMTDPFYRPADQSTRGAQARAAAGRAGRSSEKSQFSTAVWVSVRCVFPCRGEGR